MDTSIDFSQLGFVIGAGAHVPYGMPTSASLTNKIKELNHPRIRVNRIKRSENVSDRENEKRDICQAINRLGLLAPPKNPSSINEHDINIGKALDHFLDTFAKSQVYSVDAFLAKYINEHIAQPDDLITRIGKIVLIYFIAKFENQTPAGYHDFDWIQFIINEYLKDKTTMESFFQKPPTIYTFNYDRIFEQSIHNHLINFHFIEPDKATAMVQSLGINHIYGDLGPFEKAFDFSNPQHLKSATERIKVIGEERFTTSEEISSIFFSKTKSLRALYFLGYGFDSMNTKLLLSKFHELIQNRQTTRLPNRKPHPPISFPNIYATSIKLSLENKRRAIRETLPLRILWKQRSESAIEIDSLNLLRTVAPFEVVLKEPNPPPELRRRTSWITDYE